MFAASPGLLHLKRQQDEHLPPEEHYIRKVIEITDTESEERHEEDAPAQQDHVGLRIVICMSKEGSERLAQAQYIQSDIAFQRVVGFDEFEMACVDRVNNTSMCCHNSNMCAGQALIFNRYYFLPCIP